MSAGAALEMFHAFALIHDDIMDRSDSRRGKPTVHRCMAAEFTPTHSPADADQLGVGAAILIGDLALTWSDELLHGIGMAPDRLLAALSLIDEMRTEVMYGQYLDLTGGAAPEGRADGTAREARTDRPLTVIRYTSRSLRPAWTASSFSTRMIATISFINLTC